MQAPRTVCPDCRRPICVADRDKLDATGIEGCFYCETIHLKDTNKIQEALDDMRDKLLQERAVKTITGNYRSDGTPMPFISTRTDQAPPMPEYGKDTPYSTLSHAMAGIRDNEGYPHRDGSSLMDQDEGWGPPMGVVSGKQGVFPGKVKSVKMDIKHANQGPYYSVGDREPHFVEGEQKVSGTIELVDTDPDFLRSLMEKPQGEVPIGFATKSGEAGDTIAIQRLNSGNIMQVVANRDVMPGDPITADDLAHKREESLRGTGRTTRFCQKAFNHIKYATRKGLDAKVYYLTETAQHSKHAKRMFMTMVDKEKHTYTTNQSDVYFTQDRCIHFISLSQVWGIGRGSQATMFIVDVSEPFFEKKAKEIQLLETNMMEQRDYYQVVRRLENGTHKSISIPAAHIIETHPETGVTQFHEIQPDPTREHEWSYVLSRKEKPPKSARTDLKMRSEKKPHWYQHLIPWAILLVCSYFLFWVITR